MKKDLSPQPVFATNWSDPEQKVSEAINRFLAHVRKEYRRQPEIAIATAYFNAGGFSLVADELEDAPRVRLLLGAEPDREVIADLAPDEEKKSNLRAAVTSHEAWLANERDLLGFSPESTRNAERLVRWLRSADGEMAPKVEVRRYAKGFLHGKAFIAQHETMPTVLAGSANFTRAGLSANAELVVGVQDQNRVEYVLDWFNTFWDESEPFDLAALYEARWSEHSPWTVFLRMLWELYGDHLEDEVLGETSLKLTEFQADGVKRALRLMEEVGGVLVADEVGLGKTFIAGEIIAQASMRERQQVLVVAPAALRDGMWEPFLKSNGFSRRVQVKSFAELRKMAARDTYETEEEYQAALAGLDDFGLVVVDEAHNLRNSSADQSKALEQLLSGRNPKKVLLLTATPVNNSLADLETLIRYFVRDDAAFARVGIPSVSNFIKRAQKLDPDALTPKHLFDLMDRVAVRRTRTFVKKFYPDATIMDNGVAIPIVFPEAKLYRLDYPLSPEAAVLVDEMVYALDSPDDAPFIDTYHDRQVDERRLMLARYTSSAYAKDRELELYQVNNAGLLRSSLLKRLESSNAALLGTIRVLIASHVAFLSGMAKGRVMTGRALQEWGNSDAEDLATLLENLGDDVDRLAKPLSDFDAAALQRDVEDDLALLRKLEELAVRAQGAADTKAARLLGDLESIAAESERVSRDGVSSQDRRKVLVFSTFADTVAEVHAKVVAAVEAAQPGSPLANYKGRVAPAVSGRRGGDDAQADVIKGFAPKSSQSQNLVDKYDVLITTDVLSEGVNLQQAGRIINYDLPWNPMRIVQRHGRVDRIGSEHKFIQLGLFYPAARLDDLLNLEDRLKRKLKYAIAAVGQTEVLPGQEAAAEVAFADVIGVEQEIADVRDAIQRLIDGDAGVLDSNSGAISGEEYRRRLHKTFREDAFLQHNVKSLPFASGSGFSVEQGKPIGYVFCIKVKDAPKPRFVYVPTDADWNIRANEEGEQVLLSDTLTSLTIADPVDPFRPRRLSAVAYASAYAAWEFAQKVIHSQWEELTDPQNLRPAVPSAFRDAAALVFENPARWSAAEVSELVQRLNTIPLTGTRNTVRRILDSASSDASKQQQIKDVVEAAGLQPATGAKPLSHASLEEVRLICWMAIGNEGDH